MAGLASHEDIGRFVVRRRGEHRIAAGRIPDNEVAEPGIERVADEATPLCPPGVLDCAVQITRKPLRKHVLEPLPPIVRERQIVRIAADAKRRAAANPIPAPATASTTPWRTNMPLNAAGRARSASLMPISRARWETTYAITP